MRYHCATTLRLFAPDIMPYVNGVVPPIWRQLTKLYTFARSASSVRPNRNGRAAGHGAKAFLTRPDWGHFEPGNAGAQQTASPRVAYSPAHGAAPPASQFPASDLTALKRGPARATAAKRATMDV